MMISSIKLSPESRILKDMVILRKTPLTSGQSAGKNFQDTNVDLPNK